MPYARRTDKNLTDIVKLARALGFRVHIRNDDLADLDVQLWDRHEIWECKNGKGRYTELQKKHKEEGWNIRTVRTTDDVLAARNDFLAVAALGD